MSNKDSDDYANKLAKAYIRAYGIGAIGVVVFFFIAILASGETWELITWAVTAVVMVIIKVVGEKYLNKKKKAEQEKLEQNKDDDDDEIDFMSNYW